MIYDLSFDSKFDIDDDDDIENDVYKMAVANRLVGKEYETN